MKFLHIPIPTDDRNATVEGYYFHAELPLTETIDVRLKYDVWNPNIAKFNTIAFNREQDEQVWSTLGGALTWHFAEGALARLVYQVTTLKNPHEVLL